MGLNSLTNITNASSKSKTTPRPRARRADAAIKHPIHSLSAGGGARGSHAKIRPAAPTLLNWLQFGRGLHWFNRSSLLLLLSRSHPASLTPARFLSISTLVHLDSNRIRARTAVEKSAAALWSSSFFVSVRARVPICDWSIVISHWFWGLAHSRPIQCVLGADTHTARSSHCAERGCDLFMWRACHFCVLFVCALSRFTILASVDVVLLQFNSDINSAHLCGCVPQRVDADGFFCKASNTSTWLKNSRTQFV